MLSVESRFYRPSWIEIRRDLLVENYLKIKNSLFNQIPHKDGIDRPEADPADCEGISRKQKRSTGVMAVVKANGYGHGALQVSELLEEAGVSFFGVSCVDEGMALRKGGISGSIVILGSSYPFKESFDACFEFSLAPTISSIEAARELKSFLLGKEKSFPIHIKIETGMQRIGVRPETAVSIVEVLREVPQVVLEGICTHFACASDPNATKRQLDVFKKALSLIKQRGSVPKYIHAANSTALLKYPQTHFDCVRPGLALYGAMEGFEPIAQMKSRIIFLKEVDAGIRISYEGRFVTKRKSKMATIPLGYADGLAIAASSKAWLLVRGEKAPVCGLITMDMLMVDVTDIEGVRVGDVATLIGQDGAQSITPQDWASWSNISVYQFLTGFGGRRVPKIYI